MDKYPLITSLRKNLKNGLPTCGSWQQIPHPGISEILASQGYEWIAIDLEHGSINMSQLPILFCALELHNVLPFARLAKADCNDAHLALEAGAAGIIFPMIHSGEQISRLIQYSTWPPNGKRGVGFSRASMYGKNFEQQKQLAEKPFFVAMIESLEGIENIDSIASTPNLAAIMIGPYDLSASLGITGQFDSEKFKIAVEKIENATKKFKIPKGIHVVEPSKEKFNQTIQKGYQFIAYSTDALFLLASSKKPIF